MAAEKNNLQVFINKIAKERGYSNGSVDIQDISPDGGNYSSTLHLANISAPTKEDLKLFIKVACLGEDLRESEGMFAKFFDTERVFYTDLAGAFERLYDKHGLKTNDRLFIPKYYGYESSDNKETLVLENLTASGFESFDRLKPFDWDYASSAVAELAKFHALGITAKEENLEELENLRKIGLDVFAVDSMVEVFINQALKFGKRTVKKEYRVRLQKYLKKENMRKDLAVIWKTLDSGFLIHSDYRPNNLMHRNKNGKVEIVPLDYQTLHFGLLAADLNFFIWCGSDSKFRQAHYQQLLEHYYTELTIALKNLHVDINKVYPRKTFEQELEESKTLGLMLGLGMMSILTVDPENAPEMKSMDNLVVEPNQLGLKKMNEVVEDYIGWEII